VTLVGQQTLSEAAIPKRLESLDLRGIMPGSVTNINHTSYPSLLVHRALAYQSLAGDLFGIWTRYVDARVMLDHQRAVPVRKAHVHTRAGARQQIDDRSAWSSLNHSGNNT
jgi:hypothetical protein